MKIRRSRWQAGDSDEASSCWFSLSPDRRANGPLRIADAFQEDPRTDPCEAGETLVGGPDAAFKPRSITR